MIINHDETLLREIIEFELERIKKHFEIYKEANLKISNLIIFQNNMNEDEMYEYGKNLINSILDGNIPDSISIDFLDTDGSYVFRPLFIELIGHCVVTKEFALNLKNKVIKDSKCLEIMCGTGALSKALQDIGVDIIATDNYSIKYGFKTKWTEIEELECLEAIRKYGKDVDYIIASWIPYNNNIGYKALKLMNEINPNCKMISINEEIDMATATREFYENSKILFNFINDNKNRYSYNGIGDIESVSYKTWDGLYDYVSVIQFDGE